MTEHVFRINNSPDGAGRYCYVGDIGQPDLRVQPDDRIADAYPDTDEEVEGWPEAADTHPELFEQGDLIVAADRARDQRIREIRQQYPHCRIQCSAHGAGRYSVQVFDKWDHLVVDINL